MNKQNKAESMNRRPIKGEIVVDANRRRWRVVAIDIDDEGIVVERYRSIRFVKWHQYERHWRKV